MKIGDRIKKIRKSRKLTLVEFGKKIGLSKSTISKYENNAINIPSDKLEEIAKTLEVSIAYLLGMEKQIEDEDFVDTSMLSESQIEELELILNTNKVMFFKGNKASQKTAEKLRASITRLYIESLKETKEI